MSKPEWPSMSKSSSMSRSSKRALSILLAGLASALSGALGCASHTPGIEVELMVMPLNTTLAEANADLGMDELTITATQLVLCPTSSLPQTTHSHAQQGAFTLGSEPVPHTMAVAPGAYCDLRVGIAAEGVAARETVLRVGCADARTPISLDANRRRASLVMTFPTTLDVHRIGEADIDRQRTFDALVRGIAVERVDCESIQP